MANTKKTEAVELTPHEQWQIKREARMAKRNASASELSEGQLRALKQAYIAIRHADFSCHEMYAVSELTCTCDED